MHQTLGTKFKPQEVMYSLFCNVIGLHSWLQQNKSVYRLDSRPSLRVDVWGSDFARLTHNSDQEFFRRWSYAGGTWQPQMQWDTVQQYSRSSYICTIYSHVLLFTLRGHQYNYSHFPMGVIYNNNLQVWLHKLNSET